jgi:glutaredoxin
MLSKFRTFMVPASTVLCPCSADDLELLDKKEMELQTCLTDKMKLEDAMEWKWTWKNWGKRISMPLSPVQIVIYNTPNNVEYFKFFV